VGPNEVKKEGLNVHEDFIPVPQNMQFRVIIRYYKPKFTKLAKEMIPTVELQKRERKRK